MSRHDYAVLGPALAAVSLFKLILLSYPVTALPDTLSRGEVVLGIVALLVVVVAQPVVTVAVVRGRRHDRLPAVLAVAEVAFALPPLFLLGDNWSALPIMGLADVLVCLAGVVRIALFGTGLAVYVVGCVLEFGGVTLVQQLGEALLSVTIFYAVLRMATFIRELAIARLELTRLAVAQERLRMARDLHDSLGHTMTVALYRLELARRSPEAAEPVRTELGDVSELLREAVRALQDVVAGARTTTLRDEITGALSVLRSAGIETSVVVGEATLAADVELALSWIVREGTTNVLRHSAATVCTIRLDPRPDGTVELTMDNDAPTFAERRWAAPSGGHGVVGMRQRLSAIGGRLTIHQDQLSYRMVARVPGVPA